MTYKIFEGKPKFGKPMFYISDESGARYKGMSQSPNRKYLESLVSVNNELADVTPRMVKAYKEGNVSLGDSLGKQVKVLREKKSSIHRGLF